MSSIQSNQTSTLLRKCFILKRELVKTVSEASLASGFTVLWDRMIVRRAADTQVAGKEGRNVRDDGHEGAGQGALVCGSHGDDDVILVPHVEGIRVWVGEGRGDVQGADSLCCLAVFGQVIIKRAQ